VNTDLDLIKVTYRKLVIERGGWEILANKTMHTVFPKFNALCF